MKNYFTPELDFTGSYDQVITALRLSKNIEKLHLSIRNPQGIHSLQDYKELFNIIVSSKNLLTHFTLKIMDM